MPPHPCLKCGSLIPKGSKCPCSPPWKPSSAQRGYDYQWRQLRALAIAAQPWCSDCGTREDLTGDHLRKPARSTEDIEVVCRSCNSKRGPAAGR